MANFVPEMHDIGKLIPKTPNVPTTDGTSLKSHNPDGPSFRNLDWGTIGESEPTNSSWLAIVYHIDKQTEWVRDLTLPVPSGLSISNEDRARLFLTILSDHLAATSGRVLGGKEGGSGEDPKTYRLWRTSFASDLKADPEPIRDVASLKQALNLIHHDPPDTSEFIRLYGDSLQARGEDEGKPRNVTSLYSHSLLTGKFYRVLERYTALNANSLSLEFGGEQVTTTHDAEAKWKCRLTRASVYFPQQPARPADLGIFDLLGEAHADFGTQFADHLLFASDDDLWLFAPPETSLALADLFAPFTTRGFYVLAESQQAVLKDLRVWQTPESIEEISADYTRAHDAATQRITTLAQEAQALQDELQTNSTRIQRMTSPSSRSPLIERNKQLSHQRAQALSQLNQLRASIPAIEQARSDLAAMSNASGRAHHSFYPKLTESFEPPLCEVCQMRHGDARTYGARTDYICAQCESIRAKGFSQRALTDHLEHEQAKDEHAELTRYLWLRVVLLADRLEATVSALFGQYLDTLSLKPDVRWTLQTEMRLPSLLRDFTSDFRALLNDFDRRLRRVSANTVRLRANSNLWVVPLANGAQIKTMLFDYLQTLNQFFPKFIEDANKIEPCITFSGSIAPTKYPFYEHWRYLQNPQKTINVRVIGSAQLEIDLLAAMELTTIKSDEERLQRAFLHRATAIERATQSKFLTQAAFMEEKAHSEQAQREGRAYKVLPAIRLFESGLLTADQILAYHKLTEWR